MSLNPHALGIFRKEHTFSGGNAALEFLDVGFFYFPENA
jgi:hypothetical protein